MCEEKRRFKLCISCTVLLKPEAGGPPVAIGSMTNALLYAFRDCTSRPMVSLRPERTGSQGYGAQLLEGGGFDFFLFTSVVVQRSVLGALWMGACGTP